jgi:hypothetical protein
MNALIYHLQLWIKPLAVSTVGVGFYALVTGALLRYEWGQYVPTRRVRPWIVLHLFSPVFAWLAYYAAYLPAAGVTGMEALGVFFMLIVTVTPLVYFTCHIILGRLVLLPELSVRESMILAATSIAIFGGAVLTFGFVKGQFAGADRRAARAGIRYATPAESPYIQKELIRFAMPDGETLIYASFLPKQTITVSGLSFFYGPNPATGGGTSGYHYLCGCGSEWHLVFIKEQDGLLPHMRCYWRAGGGASTFVSEMAPDLSHGVDRPFTVIKTGDMLHLPVSLPSSIFMPTRDSGRFMESFHGESCEPWGCLKDTFIIDPQAAYVLLRLERPGLKSSERHVYEFPLE